MHTFLSCFEKTIPTSYLVQCLLQFYVIFQLVFYQTQTSNSKLKEQMLVKQQNITL